MYMVLVFFVAMVASNLPISAIESFLFISFFLFFCLFQQDDHTDAKFNGWKIRYSWATAVQD